MIDKKGSILIFTLWVLIILAILSIILSRRASSNVKLARYESRNIKATYLARAGVMKMLAEIAKDTNPYDSLDEDWNRDRDNPKELTLGRDRVKYGAFDENRRLNLNGSGLEKGHLTSIGVDDSIAEEILKYRNGKDNKKFEFMEELFLVDGMTREIYSAIKDLVTIYRGTDSKVNINTASEMVLEAITGNAGNGSLVQEIVYCRKGPDGEEDTGDEDVFDDISDIEELIEELEIDPTLVNLFTVSSDVFRIWAQSLLSGDEKIVKEVEAIVSRLGKREIYHWKEY